MGPAALLFLGTLSPGHLSPHPPSHQPGDVLPSPGPSLQKGSESHRAVPPMQDMRPASRSARGGFRLGVEARDCPREGPRGLSSLQQRRAPEPSQDEMLSPPCLSIHLDRTWTTSTTARTAGSSTCWTSATWRAGESPGRAACCASCHASACLPPPPAGLAQHTPLLAIRSFLSLYTLQGRHICRSTPNPTSPVLWGDSPVRPASLPASFFTLK